MELIVVICLFAGGWIFARPNRSSDERLGIAVVALLGTAIAISRGIYWSVLPPADPYNETDNFVFGLTANQLVAFGIAVFAFIAGAYLRRRASEERGAKAVTISANADLFRKSHFVEVELVNVSHATVHVLRLAFGSIDQISLPKLISTSDGRISGNLVLLNRTLAPSDRFSVQVQTVVADLGSIWVHGLDAG